MRSVAPGRPAAIAGVLAGDLIVAYGGATVSDAASLNRLATADTHGDSVPIRVRRGSTERSIDVVRATASGTSGTVLVYYAADDDYKTAADLAAALRKSINDPRYAVRAFKTSRGIGGEGEVRYSASGLSTLAEALAKNAGSWLSRMYGRPGRFHPDGGASGHGDRRDRDHAWKDGCTGSASSWFRPSSSSTRLGMIRKWPKIWLNFLRTLRSGSKYTVRVRATTAPSKPGQIEDYDDERMAAVASILSKDMVNWMSRAYGRGVVLQPTLSSKIGANTVVLWLPSR